MLESAPSLAKLRNIQLLVTVIDNPMLDGLFGPALESAGGIVTIENNDRLTALQWPNLTQRPNELTVSNNASLRSIELPRLASAGTITMQSNPRLGHIDYAALQHVDLVWATDNPVQPTCELLDVHARAGGTLLQHGNNDRATCTP